MYKRQLLKCDLNFVSKHRLVVSCVRSLHLILLCLWPIGILIIFCHTLFFLACFYHSILSSMCRLRSYALYLHVRTLLVGFPTFFISVPGVLIPSFMISLRVLTFLGILRNLLSVINFYALHLFPISL